ncbi:hypothetical protein M8J77_012942 [Diaphorina citri]|nr:hypothetical protein M8J77_012942 [Diaphorina citri]
MGIADRSARSRRIRQQPHTIRPKTSTQPLLTYRRRQQDISFHTKAKMVLRASYYPSYKFGVVIPVLADSSMSKPYNTYKHVIK